MTNKSTKRSKIPLIIDSNKETINATDILNQFNKYFTELGAKLSRDMPLATSTPDRYFANLSVNKYTDILERSI